MITLCYLYPPYDACIHLIIHQYAYLFIFNTSEFLEAKGEPNPNPNLQDEPEIMWPFSVNQRREPRSQEKAECTKRESILPLFGLFAYSLASYWPPLSLLICQPERPREEELISYQCLVFHVAPPLTVLDPLLDLARREYHRCGLDFLLANPIVALAAHIGQYFLH